MSISENQRLHDKQQKKQNFTTVPANCVEEDYVSNVSNHGRYFHNLEDMQI